MRKDIQFDIKITAAHFLDDQNQWEVTTEAGEKLRCRFLITAIGILSAHQMPRIEGIDSFQG